MAVHVSVYNVTDMRFEYPVLTVYSGETVTVTIFMPSEVCTAVAAAFAEVTREGQKEAVQ